MMADFTTTVDSEYIEPHLEPQTEIQQYRPRNHLHPHSSHGPDGRVEHHVHVQGDTEHHPRHRSSSRASHRSHRSQRSHHSHHSHHSHQSHRSPRSSYSRSSSPHDQGHDHHHEHRRGSSSTSAAASSSRHGIVHKVFELWDEVLIAIGGLAQKVSGVDAQHSSSSRSYR